MKQEYVQNVEMSSVAINTQKQFVAQNTAPVNFVGIKGIKKIGKADVYNMTVEKYHNYIVNNGIISKNCDSDRYALYTYSLYATSGVYGKGGF